MPSINQFAHYLSGEFDESVSNKSAVFQLGGPIITIHVTKVDPSDAGIVTLQATNVEPIDGATDTYMDWQSIATCDVSSAPKSVPTYYAFGRLIYSGKGKVGCTYSDSREADSGTGGGSGSSVDFGVAGQQVAEADTAAQIRQILQLANTATTTAGNIGSQILQSNTESQVKQVLNIGTAATLSHGALGEQLVQMGTVNELKSLLTLGSAAYLNAGATGQAIIQAQDPQGVKNTLGLSSLASTTPSVIGHNIVTADSEADVRTLLSLGTASLINHGTIGKSIVESVTDTDVKNLLGISFGTTSTTYAPGNHIHAQYMPVAGGQFTGVVGTSLTPSLATDLVNKQYVDTLLSGFKYKEPVEAATTANIALSGLQTIDGIALVADNRILVKNQTVASQNGIYVVATGAWSRTSDFDSWSEIPGAMVVVNQGTMNGDTGWICTSNSGGTLNATAITFVQNFTASGTFVQGAGITIAGNVISLSTDTTLRTGLNAQFLNGVPLGSGQTLNQTYPFIPSVSVDGGMEVGRYIDFHRNADGTDKHGRLEISTTNGDSSLYSSGSLIWTNANAAVSLMRLRGLTPTAGAVAFYPDSTSDAQLYTTSTWVRNTFSNVADAAAAKTALGLSTLATSGSAADLTTGTIPDGRLPARLGIGALVITDADTITGTGDYSLTPDGANNPSPGSYTHIRHTQHGDVWATQVGWAFAADSSTNSFMWRREKNNGTWSAWYRLRPSEGEQALLWAPINHTHSYLPLTGGSLTGPLILSADPTNSLGAATKQYVDNISISTTNMKAGVHATTTANIILSGTQTIDGVAVVAGNRVLVRNQTTTTQNGIYIVSAGAWARSTDANTWDKMAGAIIPVMQGSTRSGYIYVCTSIPGASTIDVGSFSFTSKYLSTTGGILTGILTLSGDPSSALDAAPKQYVDNKYYSVTNKQPALVATTANITLSGLQTIDGITLVANDRVLVKDQTTASQNGIYFASSGLWGREADAVDWSTIYNTVITIKSGTVNAGTMWYSTATASGILGTTSLNFARANKYAAGTGISINETTKAISISATGITAGTYNGITFGTDGRATAATALNYSDLANKPTSIDEFGLTNNYTVNKIGYATGAGGSVTQTTSKSTGVTLDKMCGSIVMNSAALAANATASFTFTNANIAAGDCVLVWHAQGGTAGAYRVDTYGIAVGSCTVRVQNVSAGSLSEIFTVRFMIFRAITS